MAQNKQVTGIIISQGVIRSQIMLQQWRLGRHITTIIKILEDCVVHHRIVFGILN